MSTRDVGLHKWTDKVAFYCCLKIKISHKFGREATNFWVLPAANVNELSQVRIGLIYIYISCMGHIHKSKACKQAHPLELSVVMGRNHNLVGGAGAAAHSRRTQGIILLFHQIPHNTT